MNSDRGALTGFKVVDLTRVLAGPFCTQTLADHGAEVVKIEPPTGDETRGWGPPFAEGEAAYFLGINRNKRGIALDLSRAEGQEVLFRLLEGADCLIENFKAGTLEKWGIGYDAALKARFPRLIHCHITGFGEDGPLGGAPGYDAVAQALSGMISINGHPQGQPVRVGMPMADLGAGLVALYAILMAALERERSGQGQSIEVTLYDSAFSLLHPYNANYLLSGKRPERTGNQHPNIAPYDVYQTKSCAVFIGIGNDRQFARFMAELGKPEIAQDSRFASNADRNLNREALTALLRARLADEDGFALSERLLALGVPCGAVQEIPEVVAHPHTAHREMVVEKDGYRGTGLPAKLKRTPGTVRARPPHFAEHSREVLTELGYSDGEVDALAQAGVVVLPKEAAK
ncbi:MAG: CaiB/BaiF CoA-transferase family protein [Alphaproteobacteria bacterium]